MCDDMDMGVYLLIGREGIMVVSLIAPFFPPSLDDSRRKYYRNMLDDSGGEMGFSWGYSLRLKFIFYFVVVIWVFQICVERGDMRKRNIPLRQDPKEVGNQHFFKGKVPN